MRPTASPAPPGGFRTRGHDAAASIGLDLVRSARAHAILLVGPAAVGKTTLALDLAAWLLCTAPPEDRPCRVCRGCRMVEGGNHPDLHRLAPEGPGGQIRIGARSDPERGTVRRLLVDLALLPVEGGARVAIVEHADRLNEDAQSALLKTLEEPPAGVTLLLCADEEERLLPTVRSRAARVRLGPLGTREVEGLLGELAAVDAPTAARLARLTGGRPGIALLLAAAPDAARARTEVARELVDLLSAPRAARLAAVRRLLGACGDAAAALARVGAPPPPAGGRGPKAARAAGRSAPRDADPSDSPASTTADAGESGDEPVLASGDAATGRRTPAADRRRAAILLVEIWRTVTRDLALVALGERGRLRDPALLDDLVAVAGGVAPDDLGRFLVRLDRAAELLEANVSPELVADSLALAWPRSVVAP